MNGKVAGIIFGFIMTLIAAIVLMSYYVGRKRLQNNDPKTPFSSSVDNDRGDKSDGAATNV